MTTPNRPTITPSRVAEEIGTTVRGTSNALTLIGALSLAYALVAQEQPMDAGLETGLSAIFGAGAMVVGVAGRAVGGWMMGIQRPKGNTPPTNG